MVVSLLNSIASHTVVNVSVLRVLAHSLSVKNPPNRPRLLGRVKLILLLPELLYLCRSASTTRRKHLPRMKTGSRSSLKKYLVTILDFMGSTAQLPP